MTDRRLPGMTIRGKTKRMRRMGVKGLTPQVKVIPRSNTAYKIVPLPENEVDLLGKDQQNHGEHIRLGMLRTDI